MRDPMSWALPLFRASGIPVKLHVFFIIVTLGLFVRQVTAKDNPIEWGDVFLFTIVLLFVVILLHEFGHAFAARALGGEAREILIWPLGGLAMVEIPNTPRAHLLTAVAGPAVNALICVAVAVPLLVSGFVPNANPLANPFVSEMYNYRDGRDHTSEYGLKVYKAGTNEQLPQSVLYDVLTKRQETGFQSRVAWKPETAAEVAAGMPGERAVAPGWAVWLNRTFWLSWVLLLFNLVPAYPLDGGQVLQSVVWGRSDLRRGVTVAAYTGFAFALIFLIVSVAANETLFMGLSLFMLYSCSQRLQQLDTDEGPFGYDFSAGYTSLERDDEPPPRPKRKQGALARWWQARKARKIAAENAQRVRDEERMEELLGKIAATGMGSLTDEERRFLERFSARYRRE
ncbi:M50 family metallopeptidase [Urbifossiella limnaea]|uniref:Peptidase family M50 n=1 Tax=Urbifossiella limnaea TaxID=2528023 RepID=A0A517XVS3_9BACT|nr:M50 family metallopeptidase [Urbifossiella limnaea]QDU21612.1 Peptidase family M50 [Urbifossiella limnaea]